MSAVESTIADATPQLLRIALVGVPNCGKTALFNRLTGSRQKVANYAGVTVERKEGWCHDDGAGRGYRVLDLPGSYSLAATTLDEAITRDAVLGRLASETPPDLIVNVVDATNLGFVFSAVQIRLSPGSGQVPHEPAKIS